MDKSIGERILDGLNVSLIGMTITISTLVCLSLVILVLSRAVAAASRKSGGGSGASGGAGTGQASAQPRPVAFTPVNNATTAGKSEPVTAGADVRQAAQAAGGELVAVFAAAIAALTGESVSQLRIVSFRKTGQTAPAWNLRGRNDYLSGKL